MTGFLLDTNIPSELIRSRPERRVTDWVYNQPEKSLFLSVVCVGELMRGFTLMPSGLRRTDLEQWFHAELIPRFEGRILPITHAVAERWGVLDATAKLKGRALSTADGLIAATALEHGLTLVTRNVRDLENLNIPLLDPWTSI